MGKYTKEQMKRLYEFATMTDFEFYDKYLGDAFLEEQAAFMKEFPEFMSGERVEDIDADEIFWKIKEKIEKE